MGESSTESSDVPPVLTVDIESQLEQHGNTFRYAAESWMPSNNIISGSNGGFHAFPGDEP